MIAKIYWVEEIVAEGGERVKVRSEEVVQFFNKEHIEKQLMIYKIDGTLGGYQYYDFDSVSDFQDAERNPQRWNELQERRVYQWFDKGAVSNSRKVIPGGSVRANYGQP